MIRHRGAPISREGAADFLEGPSHGLDCLGFEYEARTRHYASSSAEHGSTFP
jgi:hypothetical protein